MDGLDCIIKKIYKLELMIVINGDFNINYLAENDMRKQLDATLISYNPTCRVISPQEFRINPVQKLIPFL